MKFLIVNIPAKSYTLERPPSCKPGKDRPKFKIGDVVRYDGEGDKDDGPYGKITAVGANRNKEGRYYYYEVVFWLNGRNRRVQCLEKSLSKPKRDQLSSWSQEAI